MPKKIISFIFIFLGTLCVILGFVGIFIPVLPTTPFLLLAAYLYARSSPRFLNWLLANRLFGKFIDDYRSGRGIRLGHKIVSLSFLWITIISSIIWVVNPCWARIALLLIAIGVTIHLIKVKTFHLNKMVEETNLQPGTPNQKPKH